MKKSPCDIAPVALSCGEPAGIGPEIAVKAWAELGTSLPFFWIGDPAHLPNGAPATIIDDPARTAHAAATGLPVLPHAFKAPANAGLACPDNAQAVVDVIERAVGLVQSGAASALCTAPINKKVLMDWADFPYPGHTEYLAHLAGVSDVVMMLAADALKVVPTTIHIPLSKVPSALTPALLETTIRITRNALIRDFGICDPRIAVAGLNPHAGEDGALGTEETVFISPLLDKLRAQGINLIGPMSADTMFHSAARKNYDVAIAMYHDQALIPIKTLAFDDGVNVTLGLPFIRTSPDHGTAFDIAGKDQANPSSLIAALKLAREMAQARAHA